jgi:hypothetical protein
VSSPVGVPGGEFSGVVEVRDRFLQDRFKDREIRVLRPGILAPPPTITMLCRTFERTSFGSRDRQAVMVVMRPVSSVSGCIPGLSPSKKISQAREHIHFGTLRCCF